MQNKNLLELKLLRMKHVEKPRFFLFFLFVSIYLNTHQVFVWPTTIFIYLFIFRIINPMVKLVTNKSDFFCPNNTQKKNLNLPVVFGITADYLD